MFVSRRPRTSHSSTSLSAVGGDIDTTTYQQNDNSFSRPAKDGIEDNSLPPILGRPNSDSVDIETQIANVVLDGVQFRKIADDEEDELISDGGRAVQSLDGFSSLASDHVFKGCDNLDDPRARRCSTAYPIMSQCNREDDGSNLHPSTVEDNSSDGFDPEFSSIELHREKGQLMTDWCGFGSDVSGPGCPGCSRLSKNNQKLRRQLDELEFEVASTVVSRESNNFADDVNSTTPSSHSSQKLDFQVGIYPLLFHPDQLSGKKGCGWVTRLIQPAARSAPSSRPSERSRLRSQVQALSVTTEYLWRKLNKAELELRQYRLKDIRGRMEKVQSKEG